MSLYLFPEMYRGLDLHIIAVGKDFLDKIIRRSQIIAEHGIVIAGINLFLGMMERQSPEILPLRAIYLQLNDFRRAGIFHYHTESIVEICIGAEISGNFESIIRL